MREEYVRSASGVRPDVLQGWYVRGTSGVRLEYVRGTSGLVRQGYVRDTSGVRQGWYVRGTSGLLRQGARQGYVRSASAAKVKRRRFRWSPIVGSVAKWLCCPLREATSAALPYTRQAGFWAVHKSPRPVQPRSTQPQPPAPSPSPNVYFCFPAWFPALWEMFGRRF